MTDTSDNVARVLKSKFRAKSGEERLRMGFEMFDFAKRVAAVSHGGLSRAQRRADLFRRFYGNDFDEATRERIVRHLLEGG